MGKLYLYFTFTGEQQIKNRPNSLAAAAYPDDDFVGEMGGDQILRVGAMRTQRDNQLEVSLVWVRLAAFAHVVGRRFTEVKSTHDHLRHVLSAQVHPSHRHTAPCTPSYLRGSRTRPQPAIDRYGAVSTFHDDNICETRFSMLCTSCLELTTANCSQ